MSLQSLHCLQTETSDTATVQLLPTAGERPYLKEEGEAASESSCVEIEKGSPSLCLLHHHLSVSLSQLSLGFCLSPSVFSLSG